MTHMVIFRVGGVSYALPRAQTEQVPSDVRVTRVPLAVSAFDGVVYMKSRLVPVLHVRKRLGLPPAEASEATLLVRWEGEWLGLRVDAVEGEAAGDPADASAVLFDMARLLAHGAPVGAEVVVPRSAGESAESVPLGTREV